MISHKKIDTIILTLVSVVVILAILVMTNVITLPLESENPGYKSRLFDQSKVHHIDIEIDDWESFLSNALEEEYVPVNLTIDDEVFKHVGLRTKGNNSLRLINRYGLDRYSLKIEFNHYFKQTYYGLDKFSLDTSFQDNSYLKSFLVYDMMAFMGVKSPLTSYTWVTINGEDWGLFLAIEEPEEAFARRNYGNNYGQLYKPEYKWLKEENADVHLRYIDDEFESYDNIFRKAKFKPSQADKKRLIKSLKILDSKENLETAVDIDAVLRYFTVQVFVVNMDSYLGHTGHNYFLYEKDGIISMLPWDYNLAFATYSLGMPTPINDSTLYINYPIDTPYRGEVMRKRPLYHHLMLNKDYFNQYHTYFDEFIKDYFESGYFTETVDRVVEMISPYVKKDPTKFISYEDYLVGVETITHFNLLRAESVRKQLSGIIPSTIKGQNKDKSNFIDGSSVWLPDMGEIDDLKNPPQRDN